MSTTDLSVNFGGFRPHPQWCACVFVWKRIHFDTFRLSSTLKRPKTSTETETFENGFKSGDVWKNASFWKRSVSSADRWKQWRKKRHMPSVPVQIGANIQDGGCRLTHAQSQVPVVSSFSSVLVWTGENDTKTLVWMKIFCFVFAAMKTDTFENALVWMGP